MYSLKNLKKSKDSFQLPPVGFGPILPIIRILYVLIPSNAGILIRAGRQILSKTIKIINCIQPKKEIMEFLTLIICFSP